MRHIAHITKDIYAARPETFCGSAGAVINPVQTGSMALSLFCRQYGMNT